jgi:hypothetical protein
MAVASFGIRPTKHLHKYVCALSEGNVYVRCLMHCCVVFVGDEG